MNDKLWTLAIENILILELFDKDERDTIADIEGHAYVNIYFQEPNDDFDAGIGHE